MTALTDLAIAEARGLKARKFSARELAAAHNDAVEEIAPLNAFVTTTPERALEMAEASDARLAKGEALPLDGIPVAIKDLFCTRGVLTTASSHILDGFRAAYRSVAKLWNAGGNARQDDLDEFDGFVDDQPAVRPDREPWRRRGDNRPLVPGGSSEQLLQPRLQRMPRWQRPAPIPAAPRSPAAALWDRRIEADLRQMFALGRRRLRLVSLDHPGPMTRTVRDAAIVLGVMAGHDPRDSTSAPAVPGRRR